MSGRLIEPDLSDMIREVRREVQMRERLYPQWAREGRANARRLEWQLDVMRAVLQRLESWRSNNGDET